MNPLSEAQWSEWAERVLARLRDSLWARRINDELGLREWAKVQALKRGCRR